MLVWHCGELWLCILSMGYCDSIVDRLCNERLNYHSELVELLRITLRFVFADKTVSRQQFMFC
jgi:hypothetical protein